MAIFGGGETPTFIPHGTRNRLLKGSGLWESRLTSPGFLGQIVGQKVGHTILLALTV